MKEEVLLEEKNLIKKKIDYSAIKMPKRSNEEKNFVKDIISLMKENKELEREEVLGRGEKYTDSALGNEGEDEDEE